MKIVINYYNFLGVYMIRVYLFLGLLLTGALLFCPAEGVIDETYVDSLAGTPELSPRRSDLDTALALKDLEYLDAYYAQVKVEQGLRNDGQLARVPDLKSIARPQLEMTVVQTVIDSGCYTNKEKRNTLKTLFNLGVPFSEAQKGEYVRIKRDLEGAVASIPSVETVMKDFYNKVKKD